MADVVTQLPDSSSNSTPVKTNPNVKIMLGDVTEHNKLQLKKINNAILPVTYNDAFYKEIIASEIHCCQLAYFNDLVVAGMCFRMEDSSDEKIGINNGPTKPERLNQIINAKTKRIYIMTLGCLSAYRRYGIGTKLVEFIIQQAKDYGDVDGIFLHVQTSNLIAKAFYEKLGFQVVGDVWKDYYNRIEPRDAYLLGYKINPTGIKKIKLSSNVTVVSNILEKEKENERKEKLASIKQGQGKTEEINNNTVKPNAAPASKPAASSNSKKNKRGKRKK